MISCEEGWVRKGLVSSRPHISDQSHDRRAATAAEGVVFCGAGCTKNVIGGLIAKLNHNGDGGGFVGRSFLVRHRLCWRRVL